MHELAHMQHRWLAGLLSPEQAAGQVTSGLSGGNRSAAAAFALYVNSVRGAIRSSLSKSFPATVAALGPRFGALLPRLLATQPPTSGDLGRYDATFVAWLSHTHDEVADLARFEWLAEHVRGAQPRKGLSAAALQQCRGSVRLNQHVTLFATERAPPVPVYGAHFWALVGGEAAQQRPLTRAEYALLKSLEGAGMPLVDALRMALFVDETFDPLVLLQWLVTVQGLVGVVEPRA